MAQLTTTAPRLPEADQTSMTKLEAWLLTRNTPTFTDYYNGKMSYNLHGSIKWKEFIAKAFAELGAGDTSENVFKSVIDLYAENLVPVPKELRGFSNVLVPLLSRGECVVVVTRDGEPHFAEHFEMISDGAYTVAAIFTRSIEKMEDYVTFAYSNGTTRLFSKPVPDDMAKADATNYHWVEQETGNTLFRFALDDKGFGSSMAALQDRVNHSIIDQTIVAEMYARPFWYLLNFETAPENPFMPAGSQAGGSALKEAKTDSSGGQRIFTTSSEGPFGQLTPPTIGDMIAYHDSILDKASQATGIPQFYFKPGSGAPPTGVALKVLSKRFNNKIARMREDIEPQLEALADLLGVEKTREVVGPRKPKPATETPRLVAGPDGVVTGTEAQPTLDGLEEDEAPEMEYEFWSASDDLLQESLDAHGISLSQMGYPLNYIAEVVTPGVDLDDYADDSLGAPPSPALGVPTDMTALGQPGLPATPGQVQQYAQNPGQRAARPGAPA